MKLTLPHHTTQAEAIEKIDIYADELIQEKYDWVEIVDPKKEWDDNIVRFSFSARKMIFNAEFYGNVIVTDQEAILETEIPNLVLRFASEEEIKENIKKEFDKLFNIQ